MSVYTRSPFSFAVLAFSALALSALQPTAARGQAPDVPPRISIVLQASNRLMEDTQFMMALSPQGSQEWKDVEEFAREIFFPGIEMSKPVRIDVIVGDGKTRYRPSFPVQDHALFLENIDAFGITTRKQATDYWRLGDAFKGYMRIKDDYATLAEKENDVPPTLAAPTVDIAPLLNQNLDVAIEVSNAKVTEADRAARRAAFAKDVRAELNSGVARLDDESKEDFDLRKAGIAQQLEELERYYADTARAVIGWDASTGTATGKSTLLVEPIPGSDFDAAVQLLGQKPSYFANVPRTDTAILSFRLNHPLDPLRQKHFAEFYQLLIPSIDARIAAGTKTEAEKTASRQLAGLVVDMLADGAKKGVADGFIEVADVAGGKNVGVAGIRSPNGKQADAIVKLLPQANTKIQVRADVATVGNVAIHEVMLPLADMPDYVFLFGENPTLYVGTSPDAVWFAAGPNAVQSLHQAVNVVAGNPKVAGAVNVVDEPQEAEETRADGPPTGDDAPKGDAAPSTDETPKADVTPKADAAPNVPATPMVSAGPVVDLFVHLKPWIEYRERKANGKGDAAVRKIALEALAKGDDTLSLQLVRTKTGLAGEMVVKEAVLRLVGRLMGKFSDENL